MSVRKNRSKAFLANEFAAYTIFVTLIFHHYIGRVTKIAFKLHDEDKSSLLEKPLSEKEKKRMRRATFKGAQLFHIPDFEEGERYGMVDLFDAARDTINMFWRALLSPEAFANSMFALAAELFWPSNRPVSDMLEHISRDILKAIAGLKWRLLQKAKEFPYKFLPLHQTGASEADWEAALKEFLGLPQCCLDVWWSRPVRLAVVLHPGPEEQLRVFRNHIESFANSVRSVSSREENLHAQQRRCAAGSDAAAKTFEKQAAQMVLRQSWDNFCARCKVKPRGAPAAVRAASKVVRKGAIKSSRPHQLGNALFSYVASRRRADSTLAFDVLKAEWNGMSEAERAPWKSRQRLKVATRRFQERLVLKHKDQQQQQLDQEFKTPWGLGSSEYPLKPELLQEFTTPFRKKNTGMRHLASLETQPAKLFHDAVQAGRKVYHSMDAAVLGSKAMLGQPITNQIAADGTWGKISKLPKAPKPCMFLHPGVCKSKEGHMLPAINSMWQSLPRKDGAVLMLELTLKRRGRNPIPQKGVVFLRMVTGQGLFFYRSRVLSAVVSN